MEFLWIFKDFIGETLFLPSVLSLKLRINLAFAAKMHGYQGKNAAKIHDLLEKLAALVKKSLDFQ